MQGMRWVPFPDWRGRLQAIHSDGFSLHITLQGSPPPQSHLPRMILQWRRICLGSRGSWSKSPKPGMNYTHEQEEVIFEVSSGQILEILILNENSLEFQWRTLKCGSVASYPKNCSIFWEGVAGFYLFIMFIYFSVWGVRGGHESVVTYMCSREQHSH